MISRKKMRWFSAGLSFCLAVQTFAFPAYAQPQEEEQQWKSVAFGQSTDMNFSSTILPEKVGVNYTYPLGSDIPLPTEEEAPVQDVSIESRGGKIKSSHDGLTFYYTEVPADKNFKLVADVTIEQLGPENGSAPNAQEGCGLMVRDVNSPGRKEPLEVGYEEYPAASNMVMLELVAASKAVNADINLKAMARYGVNNPAGNGGVVTPNKVFASKVAAATTSNAAYRMDLYEDMEISTRSNARLGEERDASDKNRYNTTLKLGLERTDDGFTTTYYNSNGTVKSTYTFTDSHVTPNIVTYLDPDYYRVGFFASRNARMTVENIELTLTDVETPDLTPAYQAVKREGIALHPASALTTNSETYTVQTLSNLDGTMKIEQNGRVIAEDAEVTGGSQFSFETTLTEEETEFILTMTSIDNQTTSKTFTVKKAEYPDDLYTSPLAAEDGDGTAENPMPVGKAIARLVPGGTLYLTEGVYDPITIPMTAAGNEENRKSMVALGDVVVTSSRDGQKLFVLDSDYWNISGLDVDGRGVSGSRGFLVHGSNNVIEKCKIHDTSSDAGLTITKSRGQRTLWPSYNLVENCEAYRNIDASSINADGFASKSGSGDNNKFSSCVSYDNADDGWDLFNTLDDGPNGMTTIENCIAYNNGNNGFKLGGEGREVSHVLRNSIAFYNGLDGITDNFNPGELLIENNTSFDNTRFNYIMRPSPYKLDADGSFTADGTILNNVSFRFNTLNETEIQVMEEEQETVIYDDKVSAKEKTNNYFFMGGENSVDADEFTSLDPQDCYSFDSEGNLVFGTFLRPSDDSRLAENGAGANIVPGSGDDDNNGEDNPGDNPGDTPGDDNNGDDNNGDNPGDNNNGGNNNGSVSGGSGSGSGRSSSSQPKGKSGSWKQNTKGWWYEQPDGSFPASKWEMIAGTWYHFDGEGYMQTGWLKDTDERWYYLNPVSDGTRGAMQTGWKQIENVWYYLNPVSDGSRGALYVNTTTPDGYQVDSDGRWISE